MNHDIQIPTTPRQTKQYAYQSDHYESNAISHNIRTLP